MRGASLMCRALHAVFEFFFYILSACASVRDFISIIVVACTETVRVFRSISWSILSLCV